MGGGGNVLLGATFNQGSRTSSKKHVKNSIPFLGMRNVHGDLQRLNK